MDGRGLALVAIVSCMSVTAMGLTGSGDSPIGALDTVAPIFSNIVASPPEGAAGDVIHISFEVSEILVGAPVVTVNGNAAALLGSVKSTNYTYEYTVQEVDPLGLANIAVSGFDVVGNPGSGSGSFGVIEPVASLPLSPWSGVILILMAVLSALARWRRVVGLSLILTLPALSSMAAGPVISNVDFIQNPTGTGTEVVITYDLTAPNGPCDITVSLSKDGGNDGFAFPVTSVTGDLSGVFSGTGLVITWDIAADYPDEDLPEARLRVTADDGLTIEVPETVFVPAGSFMMGNSGNGEDAVFGMPNEFPAHEVTLSAFEIGKFEVTTQEICDVFNWANSQGRFTSASNFAASAFGQVLLQTALSSVDYVDGQFQPRTRSGLPAATPYSLADHPIYSITWYGAVAYCNWLSELEGLTPVYDLSTWEADFSNDGYHLPTEAQWERAAAWDGAKHWVYAITEDSYSGWARVNSEDDGAYVNPLGFSSDPRTSPVGWFNGTNISPRGSVQTVNSVSPLGLYDMSGNVAEWCHDWYGEDYYLVSPANNPTGPETGTSRILRGGSWETIYFRTRSASRDLKNPAVILNTTGFRVSRTF